MFLLGDNITVEEDFLSRHSSHIVTNKHSSD